MSYNNDIELSDFSLGVSIIFKVMWCKECTSLVYAYTCIHVIK